VGNETYWDPASNSWGTRKTVSDTDMGNNAVASKSAAGLGSMEKNKGGEPKQLPGESMESWMARMRQYREAQDAQTQARKKALSGPSPSPSPSASPKS
jgi:hypothetical protein